MAWGYAEPVDSLKTAWDEGVRAAGLVQHDIVQFLILEFGFMQREVQTFYLTGVVPVVPQIIKFDYYVDRENKTHKLPLQQPWCPKRNATIP